MQSHEPRLKIAVIGSGIAGLTCVHVLGPHHDVVLFERDTRLGGHTNTVEVSDSWAGPLAIDTGFIVHNDRNYPNFVRLLDELGVATRPSEMSFSVTDTDPTSTTQGFSYRATNLNTVFAQRRNLSSAAMWRMLRDIGRFYRRARAFLRDPDPSTSLDEFIADGGYSRDFLELHLLPLGAAVWSADPSRFGDYPAQTLLTFFSNHGLLGVRDRPQWRTVVGGSRRYIDALAARFPGEIRLATTVTGVARTVEGLVEVKTNNGAGVFDRVVLAVHSDQALAMLVDASPAEKEVLGAIRYQPNVATLHTDTSLLPRERRAWAAWNYHRRGAGRTAATLTYDMNTLQGLSSAQRYLVSLNSDEFIDPRQVLTTIEYAHPVFDGPAIEAQRRFEEIDGVRGVHYCGAWWGYGFHEDGVSSALRACRRLGVNWPRDLERARERQRS